VHLCEFTKTPNDVDRYARWAGKNNKKYIDGLLSPRSARVLRWKQGQPNKYISIILLIPYGKYNDGSIAPMKTVYSIAKYDFAGSNAIGLRILLVRLKLQLDSARFK
jgi:hypothetical protein